ncbi:hypothetical protein [Natronorarus salvus]|uniref:hypothetical protein n=1 Tax=Natronorarus salvus TaxID=3117733 RepID=UPI002F2623BF
MCGPGTARGRGLHERLIGTVDLIGPEALTYHEVCTALSSVLPGRVIDDGSRVVGRDPTDLEGFVLKHRELLREDGGPRRLKT